MRKYNIEILEILDQKRFEQGILKYFECSKEYLMAVKDSPFTLYSLNNTQIDEFKRKFKNSVAYRLIPAETKREFQKREFQNSVAYRLIPVETKREFQNRLKKAQDWYNGLDEVEQKHIKLLQGCYCPK